MADPEQPVRADLIESHCAEEIRLVAWNRLGGSSGNLSVRVKASSEASCRP